MKNPIKKYRELSFEQRMVLNTKISLCLSTALALGKLIIGILSDYNLCGVAVYSFAMILSKLQCVLGVKSDKRGFIARNRLIAAFLFISSVVYILFMCRLFFYTRPAKDYGIVYVVLLAFISFAELGFSIAGLLRTKDKGHFYRDIKIISFGTALIAILTTQMTILDFTNSNSDYYNAYSGIGVGAFIALSAVFILLSPRLCVTDREHNVFILKDADKNRLIDTANPAFELVLCASRVYGAYIYRASVLNGRVDGNIERGKSLWKRMHVTLKILCCILSEILIFVWLAGRAVLFLRSANLPARLERKMRANGFEKVAEE